LPPPCGSTPDDDQADVAARPARRALPVAPRPEKDNSKKRPAARASSVRDRHSQNLAPTAGLGERRDGASAAGFRAVGYRGRVTHAEFEITAEVVRGLLRDQHPDLADRPVRLGARG
jgi:hypothetical protein